MSGRVFFFSLHMDILATFSWLLYNCMLFFFIVVFITITAILLARMCTLCEFVNWTQAHDAPHTIRLRKLASAVYSVIWKMRVSGVWISYLKQMFAISYILFFDIARNFLCGSNVQTASCPKFQSTFAKYVSFSIKWNIIKIFFQHFTLGKNQIIIIKAKDELVNETQMLVANVLKPLNIDKSGTISNERTKSFSGHCIGTSTIENPYEKWCFVCSLLFCVFELNKYVCILSMLHGYNKGLCLPY